MNYTIKEAWRNACEEEGIPVDTKFAEFSDDNQWAKRYEKAMHLYFRWVVCNGGATGNPGNIGSRLRLV